MTHCMGVNVYYEAYGCSQNIAETGMIARSMGKIVNEPAAADVILIGTCVVIEHTENRMVRRIRELKKYGKKMVVYGCLPSARSEIVPDGVTVIRTWELEKAPEILGFHGNPMDELHSFDSVATIPIANGCLGSCTYCITRIARGRVKSRNVEWIVKMARKAVGMGIKEIRLSAQDTAAYGQDMGTNLAELLNAVTDIEGDFRIRVGMMEPRETMRILDNLIDSYSSEKVYKFLHLPVQSGDDEILRRMNRGYEVNEFREIIRTFRRRFPEMTISTDIIVGFPGESNETFENTCRLIKEIRPDILNITRFSPRPKTPAYKWKRPSTNAVKEWSRKLGEIHIKMIEEKNRRFVGKKLRVLIPQHGKRGKYLGRTDNYRPVIIDEGEIGRFYTIEIIDSRPGYLIGKIT